MNGEFSENTDKEEEESDPNLKNRKRRRKKHRENESEEGPTAFGDKPNHSDEEVDGRLDAKDKDADD